MSGAARDFGIGLLLAALAAALYAATFQARQFGDSPLLYREFAARSHGSASWYHALYMPAAGWLGWLLGWPSPPLVLKTLSAACGAIGIAFSYALARAWSAARPAAVLAAGLLAVGPGYWFFATTVEVHTLHAACVGLCALVTLAAPWRRPLAAAPLVAGVLPLLFLSHQSGVLLGPGFLALTQFARSRRGLAPLRWSTLLFAIGPLYLAGVLAGIPISAWMSHGSLSELLGGTRSVIVTFTKGPSLADAWQGWIQPLGLLLALAIAGACSGRLRSWALATPLVFFLPSAAFFVTWGLPERGGYTLGSSMFLAVLAAVALSRPGRRSLAIGALALALQGAWGYANLRAHDAPEWGERLRDRRHAIVHAIGERGGVISFNGALQHIEAVLPDVVELNLAPDLMHALGGGLQPDEFLAAVQPDVETFLARPDFAVVLDRSYVPLFERVSPRGLPYAEALEAWLFERYGLVPVEGTDWPLSRVETARD